MTGDAETACYGQLCPDLALARRVQGYRPKVELREGMTRNAAGMSDLCMPLLPAESEVSR